MLISTRSLPARLKLLLTMWTAMEIVVFLVVVHIFGLGWALLAGFASTLLGMWLLKRTGTAAMMRLRDVLQGRHDGHPGHVLDGTLSALAAVALIVPGFVSNGLGLVLTVPAVRRRVGLWVVRGGLGPRFKAENVQSGPRTIDLDRDEWRRTRPPGDSGGVLR